VTGRLLVTGASGYVGSHLVPALRAAGFSVRAMVRGRPPPGADEVVRADLTDPASLPAAVRGVSAIVHLAAVADSADAALNRAVNVDGSLRLAEAALQAGVDRFVNVSSSCAARRLRGAYGQSKAEAEAALSALPLRLTHLRPTMIFGPGSAEWELFLSVLRRSPFVPLPAGGRFTLRPLHVGDFGALVLAALSRPASEGVTFDVAGEDAVRAHELVRRVGALRGRSPRIVPLPGGPLLAAARMLGHVLPHAPVNDDQVMAFLQDTEADIEPARRLLGWAPRPLDEGLADVVRRAR
jgi:nucleoside-diphosphate-sugar epimerase